MLSWPAVVLAALLMVVSYQLRTLRIYDYFAKDMSGGWWLSLKLVLIHNVLNNLMPMRSGELSFPLLMKRYFAIDYQRSVPALLWFRLLDLHTILTLGLLSLAPVDMSWLLIMGALLIWLSLPVLLYVMRNYLLLQLTKESGLKGVLRQGLQGLPNSHWQFIKCWVLTWMNWVLKLLVLVWVLGQFIALPWMTKLSAMIAGELTSVLPFHAPGGVGTYEAGVVAPLLPYANAELAMMAAINVHLFILSVSLFGGILGYIMPKPSEQDNHVLTN